MKKKVTVLIIDDVDQSKIIDALKKQLKRKCEFEAISIRTTDVELREDGSDHLDVRKLKERIKDLISSKHINWALTDFNLSEDDIDGINVVEILTELRKNLKIIMYSGNRNAVVKRVLGKVKLQEATEEEIVEAVRKLMEYQIIDYVKRDEYKDKLIGLINRDDEPTVHDYFLEQHLQLSLTLHAHLEFFAVESDAFFQAFQFVVVGKGLLFQVQTFLFHFNLLLLIGNHLLFPFVTLVFNIAEQIGIGKNKNGVSLLKQTSLFTDNPFHASSFTSIDLDGQYRLNEPFHIYIFHEIRLFHFCNLYIFGIYP